MPSHDCDNVTQFILMPSDPTVTMVMAFRLNYQSEPDCSIWGGRETVPDNELFLSENEIPNLSELCSRNQGQVINLSSGPRPAVGPHAL